MPSDDVALFKKLKQSLPFKRRGRGGRSSAAAGRFSTSTALQGASGRSSRVSSPATSGNQPFASRTSEAIASRRRTRGVFGSLLNEHADDQRRRTVGEVMKRRAAMAAAAAAVATAGIGAGTGSEQEAVAISASISSGRSFLDSTAATAVYSPASSGIGLLEEERLQQQHLLGTADGPSLATHLPDIVVNHNHRLPVPNQIRMQVSGRV
jgi:hypothetical protein